jgi:hypothetical protein
LEALTVLLAVKETFLVLARFGGGVGTEHMLLNGGELRKLKWLHREGSRSGELPEECVPAEHL